MADNERFKTEAHDWAAGIAYGDIDWVACWLAFGPTRRGSVVFTPEAAKEIDESGCNWGVKEFDWDGKLMGSDNG